MKDKIKLLDPMGFTIGILTGLAMGLVVGNFWIGFGTGVVIGFLIGPMYRDEKRRAKAKQLNLLTLFIVLLLLIFGAVALTLSAI